MKKLDNAAIFDDNPPPFNFEKEACRYYGRRRVAYSKYHVMPVPLFWNMYCATGLYEDKLQRGCHFRRENPGFLAIEYIKEGSMYVRQRNRMYLAETGDIVLLHPHCNHEFLCGPDGSCIKISILVIGPMLDSMLEQSGLKDVDVISNISAYYLNETFNSMMALSFDFSGIACEQVVILTYKLVQLIISREAQESMPEKLSSFIAFLDDNVGTILTLSDMAAHYGCSVPHLSRLFKRYCNSSPYHMLISLRMRRAVRLLLENKLSIKEIALRVGYESAFNFSTEFKKRFGVSPRNFHHTTP